MIEKADCSRHRTGSTEYQDCHPMVKERTCLLLLRSTVQTVGYGAVAKIGVILCPLHLSYRLSTIPLSLFLFPYNEGL